MSPTDRMALLGCFLLAIGALLMAAYAVGYARLARHELEEYKTNQVHRERRQRDLGPPRGVNERRHAHPDATLRARRRDRDDPQFGQREPLDGPQTPSGAGSASATQRRAGAHRASDGDLTEELEAQPSTSLIEQPLPRPGAIRREQ